MEVDVSDLLMILWRKVFCKITRFIVDTLVLKQIKLSSFYTVSDPIYIHINFLDFFCLRIDVNIPREVLLSVLIVVGGCGYPNSFKVDLIGTDVFAL